jgi:hypothetical protein
MKDLVVVAPDSNTEQTLYGLLERHKALQIRRIEYRILVHPERDPGVLQRGASLLAEIDALNAFRYALLIFDREGCGREMLTSSELEQQVQQQLDMSGWQERSAVVVIDPELESWVFATSPHVVDVFAGGDAEVFQRVVESFPKTPLGKPQKPKEAVEKLLRQKAIVRSSALYKELASRVSLKGCIDPAFQRLCAILRSWFPQD